MAPKVPGKGPIEIDGLQAIGYYSEPQARVLI